MSLQDGVNLAEVKELILLQVASLRPHGIQHRSCVTLREQNDQPLPRRHSNNCHFYTHPTLENQSYGMLCVCVCVTLERMKRSLLEWRGSSGRYFMVWKKSTDMISATLQHDVGWLRKNVQKHISSVQWQSELIYLHICSLKFSDSMKIKKYTTQLWFRKQEKTNKWCCLRRISAKGSRENEIYELKMLNEIRRLFTFG